MQVGYEDKDKTLPLSDPKRNFRDVDANELKAAINANDILTTAAQTNIDTHEALTNNPHSVTKTQVGLSNVDNTTDAGKPVSTAQASAIAVVQSDVNAHEALTNNPHSVTKTQVGLSAVDNTSDATKLAAVIANEVWSEVPTGTINGINNVFTIGFSNPSRKAVYCDGIRTNPSNFSVSGTTLTITNAEVIPTNSLLIDYIK